MVGEDQDHLKKIKITAMIFKIKDQDQRSFIRILFRPYLLSSLTQTPSIAIYLLSNVNTCTIYSNLKHSRGQLAKIWQISTVTSDGTEFYNTRDDAKLISEI